MKKIYWVIFCSCVACFANAQNSVKGNKEVYYGNKAYEKGDWKTAIGEYQKGLNANPKNDAARINLALAQGKLLDAEKATQNFDAAISSNKNNPALTAMLHYDKGVSLAQAKKYQEAINAFENSLRINPDNQQARENLQKAINELKQQQNKQNKQNQNKQNQQQQQNKQQQNKQNRQQQQNQMSKEQAEQMLQALREQEKETQRKLSRQKADSGVAQPDKDW